MLPPRMQLEHNLASLDKFAVLGTGFPRAPATPTPSCTENPMPQDSLWGYGVIQCSDAHGDGCFLLDNGSST